MATTDANKLRTLAAAVGVGSLALFGATACDTEEDLDEGPAEEQEEAPEDGVEDENDELGDENGVEEEDDELGDVEDEDNGLDDGADEGEDDELGGELEDEDDEDNGLDG